MFLSQITCISSSEDHLYVSFNKFFHFLDCWSFFSIVFWKFFILDCILIFFYYLYFNYFHPVYSLSLKILELLFIL